MSTSAAFLWHDGVIEVLKVPVQNDLWKCPLRVGITSSADAWTCRDAGEPGQIYLMIKSLNSEVDSVWIFLVGGWFSSVQG